MSRKEELALMYAKERRRVQSFYSRYRKKNFAIPENAIPARPKRITEGSIRRLQRMTPAFMKRKMARYEKQLKREVKRRYQQELQEAYERGQREAYERGQQEYLQTLSSFEMAKYTKDPMYLREYSDPNERMENVEKYYEDSITSLREKDLEEVGFTKSDNGYIIDTETGEIVARDMSAEIQANNDFIDDISQLEDMPDEALFAFKSEEEKDAEIKAYVDEVNRTRKENAKKGREIEKQRLRGSSKHSWAQQIINNFLRDIRRFPTMAYPILVTILDELLAIADEKPGEGKEALAKAIQETIDEYGRITRDVAYDGEYLNNYADTISRKFQDNFSALERLNDVVEDSDSSW